MSGDVSLGEIQETLFIPLYGRALDAARRRSVLNDRKAIELVESIDYDFAKFRGPSLSGSVIRASIFDDYVRRFLAAHPDGTVVDLGCGLSTRFDRLDNGRVRWFDLDVEDSMDLRRRYFAERDRYRMIAGSLFDLAWIDTVARDGGPTFVLSEAVLLYFPAAQATSALRMIAERFPGQQLAFDTGSSLMMKSQERNPVFRAVSARMKWICDDPRDLESVGLRMRESRTLTSPPAGVGKSWPASYRYGAKVMGVLMPAVARSYRMNLFDVVR